MEPLSGHTVIKKKMRLEEKLNAFTLTRETLHSYKKHLNKKDLQANALFLRETQNICKRTQKH